MSDLEETRKEIEILRKQIEDIELQKARKEKEELNAKIETQKKLDLEEHDKELIAKVEAKVKADLGIGVQSKAPEQKQESNLQGKNQDWENFRADFIKGQQDAGRTDYKGRTYEQMLKDMMNRRVF